MHLAVPSEHSSISLREREYGKICLVKFCSSWSNGELTGAAEVVVCQEVPLVAGADVGADRVGAIVLAEMSTSKTLMDLCKANNVTNVTALLLALMIS